MGIVVISKVHCRGAELVPSGIRGRPLLEVIAVAAGCCRSRVLAQLVAELIYIDKLVE